MSHSPTAAAAALMRQEGESEILIRKFPHLFHVDSNISFFVGRCLLAAAIEWSLLNISDFSIDEESKLFHDRDNICRRQSTSSNSNFKDFSSREFSCRVLFVCTHNKSQNPIACLVCINHTKCLHLI